MPRWEPNARSRLEQAALQLYGEQGFEQTTVADIAERAGLTERTFFRHFADKREVLFSGAAQLQDALVSAVVSAPDSRSPMEAVTAALQTATSGFRDRRELALRRQRVIAANPELQERELVKLARLSAALAEALRSRGVPELAASLAAEAGVGLLKVAFQRWAVRSDGTELADLIEEALEELRAITSGSRAAAR